MHDEARLNAALAAGGAPSRDPAFTMSVIRAADAERYQVETIRSVLKGGGIAAAAASLALPFLGWAGANADALESGVLATASLLVLVAAARSLSARATAMLRN